MSDDSIKNLLTTTEKLFGRKAVVIDYALETSIYHTDNSSEYIPHVTILFLNRPIVWINPEKTKDRNGLYAQRVRFECLDKNGFTDYGYVMKFLSAVCFLADGPILHTLYNAAGPFPGPFCKQETHFTCLNGMPIDLLLSVYKWETLLENDWVQLAYYRQAINSRSSLLKYLSFWKVIEAYFKNSHQKMETFINKTIGNTTGYEEWKTHGNEFYKRLKRSRDKSAHYLLSDRNGYIPHNPDNPAEYMEIQKDVQIIKFIATKVTQLRLDTIK